jgi:putative redox protein
MTAEIKYLGDLRTEATHIASGNTAVTDAPIDNFGKGEAFSPTDNLATALGTCLLTTMALAANKKSIDITGASAKVIKHMASDPRRVKKVEVSVFMPPGNFDSETKLWLENVGNNCPVALSLHPDLEQVITYQW